MDNEISPSELSCTVSYVSPGDGELERNSVSTVYDFVDRGEIACGVGPDSESDREEARGDRGVHETDYVRVAPLTQEEIASIEMQSERVMAMQAEIDAVLNKLNYQLEKATIEYFEAKSTLEVLKTTKSIYVERARILKSIAGKYP